MSERAYLREGADRREGGLLRGWRGHGRDVSVELENRTPTVTLTLTLTRILNPNRNRYLKDAS